jgi:Galactose mutarotase and related enzymes
MFSIIREDFFGAEKVKLLNAITGEYVAILPDWGGNLNELVLLNDGILHSIIAGDASIESLTGSPINFYKGAKLSPFPNRIAMGKYTFQEHLHTLDRNDGEHALHGLLWNLPFKIIHEESTADFAEVELSYNYDAKYSGYPFIYSISIFYRLESSQLSCYTTIQNSGNTAMPIGDGWHPYFSIHKKIDSLVLKLPVCRQLEMDAGIPTGNYIQSDFYQGEIVLKNRILDHSFELSATEGIVETELIDEVNKRKIVVWQECGDKGYGFLQIYTPPDRMSIAIEPMSCAPDAFNNKKGLIKLEPDEHVHFSFGIQFKSIL